MNIQNYTVPDYWGRPTHDAIVPKIQEVLNNIKTKGETGMNIDG